LTALALGAVFGTGLLAVRDPLRIEHAADDVIADAGQVADTAAANQDDRVFLQIVPFAGNVSGDLNAARQPDPTHFTQTGVRLFGSHRLDLKTNSPLLRTALHRRMFWLSGLLASCLT